MCFLDAADINVVYFEEVMQFYFVMLYAFGIQMCNAKVLVASSSTLFSP